MLKTARNGSTWLVTQPDHGEIAGYLAAHWGREDFARPGGFSAVADPGRLRSEFVLATAQHDNGWWEWEADPDLAEADGLPAGLGEVLRSQQVGMDRWRKGLGRLRSHPYASLLISHHAHWLYAIRTEARPDPAFVHPLFWNRPSGDLFRGSRRAEVEFLRELAERRSRWIAELRRDDRTARWVESETLHPHARLLQLLDGLSLSLCSALIPARSGETRGLGEDPFELRDVPRRSWDDRVTIDVRPLGGRRIALDPYPFDLDPLPVPVTARVFDRSEERGSEFHGWWNAQPPEVITFHYTSGARRPAS